jgi:pimeloyl-ACP methyl ester carboxylesterase
MTITNLKNWYWGLWVFCCLGLNGEVLLGQDARYKARDSLEAFEDSESDANLCLDELVWTPAKFDVRVHGSIEQKNVELRYPSPRPCGVAKVDEVSAEWYPARDAESGEILCRPAMVVVHESGSKMHVGRFIARDLARRGVHAFLVQLPGYGNRKSEQFQQDDLVAVFKQGIADVRRARDAVAVLPEVDAKHIGLQGTSLGGFVATLAGSLDATFDSNFLLLCGGDLHGVLTSGGADAKKALERLIASGIAASEIESQLRAVEPLRIAHRLPVEKTWLYSGAFDEVVLPKFSNRLAEAVGLPPERHVEILATHYSGIIFLPGILQNIADTARE